MSRTRPGWIATRLARCSHGRARVGERPALVSLLAINGLRVSEALGADIDALGLERGHRTITVFKGGNVVTIPLPPAPLARSTWPSANG
jgi:integrase